MYYFSAMLTAVVIFHLYTIYITFKLCKKVDYLSPEEVTDLILFSITMDGEENGEPVTTTVTIDSIITGVLQLDPKEVCSNSCKLC